MKTNKSFSILAVVLLPLLSVCQSISADKVPQEVQSAFRAKFPAATDVTWAMEVNLNYEATFISSTTGQRAEFDKNGAWVETENPINKTDIPKVVSDAILHKNPSCQISDAEEIQSAELGKMYEVGCAVKRGTSDYRVTPDGKIKGHLKEKF